MRFVGLLMVAVVVAGCSVGSPEIRGSASAPSADVSTVEGLRDRFVALGGVCDGPQVTNRAPGDDFMECANGSLLNVSGLDGEAGYMALSIADAQRKSGHVLPVALGRGWVVAAPEAADLASALGGAVLPPNASSLSQQQRALLEPVADACSFIDDPAHSIASSTYSADAVLRKFTVFAQVAALLEARTSALREQTAQAAAQRLGTFDALGRATGRTEDLAVAADEIADAAAEALSDNSLTSAEIERMEELFYPLVDAIAMLQPGDVCDQTSDPVSASPPS